MPALDRSGSALIMPLGYNTGDLENAKFTVVNGTASVNLSAGGTSGQVGTANPLPVTLQTLLAGEDLTNNIIKTNQVFSYATSFGTAGTTIKSGAGFLHAINVNNPMMFGAAGTIIVWDNTAASGTPMGTIAIPAGTVLAPFSIPFNETFSTGLTLSFGGTSLPYLNIAYR